ncbi:MAG: hypothetical protein QOH25_1741 [Acidobacteriota bacterium]|jgi:hypothetical protein|nr:hypothetical protein [Acidobacteriota bacterium]
MFIAHELSKHSVAPSGAKCKCLDIPLLTELTHLGHTLSYKYLAPTELRRF